MVLEFDGPPGGAVKGRKRPRQQRAIASGSGVAPDQESLRARARELRTMLEQSPVDLDQLRRMALEPGGFVSHELRQVIWPKIMGLNRFSVGEFEQYVRPNPQTDQIGRDVDRSLWQFTANNAKRKRRGARRKTLREMINAVVVKHGLHYYQGYHDLLSVLVLVLTDDERLCFAVAERVSLRHMRDMMRPSFDVLLPLMELLFPLIRRVDPEVGWFLEEAGVHAHFALPWLITWFSHDVKDLDVAARIFDACLCSHPLFPLYLSAAVVRHRRQGVLALDCDFAMVHQYLARLPGHLPFDALILEAAEMLDSLPPHQLARQAHNPALAALVKAGQVEALKDPPAGWTPPRTAEPDYLLIEQRRAKEGRRGKTRSMRERRRRAAEAGAVVEPRGGGGEEAGDEGGEKRGAGARMWWGVVLGGAVAVAAVYVMGNAEGEGLGAWFARQARMQEEHTRSIIAMTKRFTQRYE